MNHLIAYFGGTRQKMAEELGVSYSTLNTYINKDPRKLLTLLPELKDFTKLSADEILKMVQEQITLIDEATKEVATEK